MNRPPSATAPLQLTQPELPTPATAPKDYVPSPVALTWAKQFMEARAKLGLALGVPAGNVAYFFDQAIRTATSTLAQFPVQDGPNVPWAMAERAYVTYVKLYGRAQTIERLAERGGFSSMQEFACLFHGHQPNETHVDCITRCDATSRTLRDLKQSSVENENQMLHFRDQYLTLDARFDTLRVEAGKTGAELISVSMERDSLRRLEQCVQNTSKMLRGVMDVAKSIMEADKPEPARLIIFLSQKNDEIEDQLEALADAAAKVPSVDLSVKAHPDVCDTLDGRSELSLAISGRIEMLAAAYQRATNAAPDEVEMVVRPRQKGEVGVFFRPRVKTEMEEKIVDMAVSGHTPAQICTSLALHMNHVKQTIDTWLEPKVAKDIAKKAGSV